MSAVHPLTVPTFHIDLQTAVPISSDISAVHSHGLYGYSTELRRQQRSFCMILCVSVSRITAVCVSRTNALSKASSFLQEPAWINSAFGQDIQGALRIPLTATEPSESSVDNEQVGFIGRYVLGLCMHNIPIPSSCSCQCWPLADSCMTIQFQKALPSGRHVPAAPAL